MQRPLHRRCIVESEWRETIVEPTRPPLRFGSAVAGAVTALALLRLLAFIGGAIGLGAFEPSVDVLRRMGTGYSIWLLIALVLSAFVGGLVAAAASGGRQTRSGLLHGLVTWALMEVVLFGALGRLFVGTGRWPLFEGGSAASPAMGLWGLALLMLLALGAALLGGAVASTTRRRGRHVERHVEKERYVPPPTPPVPTLP
jgi:hypothetical protein